MSALRTIALSLLFIASVGCSRKLHDDKVPFSFVYSFGDSYSDVGNSFNLTDGAAPPIQFYPFKGRYSNGPVFPDFLVKLLAKNEGKPITARNFAFGGATTDNDLVEGTTGPQDVVAPDVNQQVAEALLESSTNEDTFPANTLVTYFAGGNDYNNLLASGQLLTMSDPVKPVITSVQDNLMNILTGEPKELLVLNFVPFSQTPRGRSQGPLLTNALEKIEHTHNAALDSVVEALQQSAAGKATKIVLFDTYSLVQQVLAKPGKLGIYDVTSPCFNILTRTLCADPTGHLWYDALHMTSKVHELIAEKLAATALGHEITTSLQY